MSRWLAGAVPLLADPDYRHTRSEDYEGLTGIDLAILAAMASFAIEGAGPPECVASIASLSRRARFGRTAVKTSLAHLETAGRISRAGWAHWEGTKSTVRWHIHGLSEARESAPSQVSTAEGRETTTTARATPGVEAAPSQVSTPEGRETTTTARATSGRETTTIGSRDDHNPSDSSRPQGRDEEGDRSSAPRTASADAAATAAPRDGSVPAHLAEIVEQLGLSVEEARTWRERRFALARTTIKDEAAFIRACVAKQLASSSRPAAEKPAKEGKGSRSAATGAAEPPAVRRPRPHHTVRRGTEAAVLAASRAGEPHEQIAERENVTVRAVDDHRRSADFAEALDAAAGGETIEQAAERFGVDPDVLARRCEARQRLAVVEALRGGQAPEQVAEQTGVDVPTVTRWQRERDESDRRLAQLTGSGRVA